MPRYTNMQFLKAIKDSGGVISTVAARIGCEWNTAHDRIMRSPKLKTALQNEKEKISDMAIGTLVKSIRKENKTYV